MCKEKERFILFDLDGTLIDSGRGVMNCVTYALEKFDIHPTDREELHPYIGPPLLYAFQQYHGLSEEQAEQALAYYRERYTVKGLYENDVYTGLYETLSCLRERGVHLLVATSKPEEFVKRILPHYDLDTYFEFVSGDTFDKKRPNKEAVIAYIKQQYPSISSDNTLMVGDTKYDVLGAHACDLPVVGVLYGYGEREEMLACGVDMLATDMADLRRILLDWIAGV
ncbi:MAG: HAD-IA family hydrolase [Clostridia bacterium]|nr:HAD-IA family hydrolase [Clostridia bacterium]